MVLWTAVGGGGGIKNDWDRAYQMTGLPPAGDDLSSKPLISASGTGSTVCSDKSPRDCQ